MGTYLLVFLWLTLEEAVVGCPVSPKPSAKDLELSKVSKTTNELIVPRGLGCRSCRYWLLTFRSWSCRDGRGGSGI